MDHPGKHRHQLSSLHSPKLQSLSDPDEHLYSKKKTKEVDQANVKCPYFFKGKYNINWCMVVTPPSTYLTNRNESNMKI